MLILSLLLSPPGSEGGGFVWFFSVCVWLLFLYKQWLYYWKNQMLFQRFYSHDQEAMA